MAIRTGAQYLESLRAHQPHVYLDGRRVTDVTREKVFSRPLAALVAQYDMQQDPKYRDVLTTTLPSGEPIARSFAQPSTGDDELLLRKALKLRTDATFGFMGRIPDYMNMFVTSVAQGAPLFGSNGRRFADNARNYYEYVRDHDLFLTHLLASPQNDRSKPSSQQKDPTLHLARVGETSDGIIVSGAKMLGTLAPFAEETLIFPMGGVAPGDDRYGVAFAIPNNTEGLQYICRETVSPLPRTEFDHPISTRFEEMDCVAIFDEVLVPWERVFIDGSPGSAEIAKPLTGMITTYVELQGAARTLSQLEFFCGLAMRVAEAIGVDVYGPVQQKLGEALLQLELARTMFWRGEPFSLWALSLHARYLHAEIVQMIKSLGGGGFFYAPSDAAFENPDLRPVIDKYLQGRDGMPARDRVGLFKLAWDVCGDGFGQRMQQYARFYAGDPERTRGIFFGVYPDKARLSSIIDRALRGEDAPPVTFSEPDLPPPGPPSGAGGSPESGTGEG